MAGQFLVKNNKRDRALLRRIAANEPQALGELYDHYNKLLFGLILSILKKRTEAENLLGQEVATIANERFAAGSHTVQFDASALSSGVYIYRLTSGANTITKRMTLIK